MKIKLSNYLFLFFLIFSTNLYSAASDQVKTDSDDFDFGSIGTLQNTKATNYDGDVLINFSSVTNDDTASIVIEFIKEYDAIS